MEKLRRVLATAVLLILFSTSNLIAAVDFASTVTFGDSLTDNQDLGLPRTLYGADPIHAVFLVGRNPTDRLRNFAVSGAESADLLSQIRRYESLVAAGSVPKATFISLEIGGNDFLGNALILSLAPSGNNLLGDEVITSLITNVQRSWTRLQRSHPNGRFVIWTVPDLTLTPGADLLNLSAQQITNIRSHLARANRFITSLGRRPNTVVADVNRTLSSLVRNPPIIFQHQLTKPPAFGSFDDLFADPIHPTAVTNALFANSIAQAMNRKFIDNIPLYTQRQLAALARIPIP